MAVRHDCWHDFRPARPADRRVWGKLLRSPAGLGAFDSGPSGRERKGARTRSLCRTWSLSPEEITAFSRKFDI